MAEPTKTLAARADVVSSQGFVPRSLAQDRALKIQIGVLEEARDRPGGTQESPVPHEGPGVRLQ